MELPSGSGDAPVMIPEDDLPHFVPFEPANEVGRKRGSKWIYDLAKGPCGECPECTRRLQKGMVLRSKVCQDPRDRATEEGQALVFGEQPALGLKHVSIVYIHLINPVVLDG